MNSFRKCKKNIALFLLPALLIYTVFEVLPSFLTIYFSFNDWNGIQSVPLTFVGLKNYTKLFHNSTFIKSLLNVAKYVAIGLVTQLPIGFGLGFLIYNVKRGKRFLKASFFIPMILSSTAVSLLWYFIYYPTDKGLLNSLLLSISAISSPVDWLNHKTLSLAAVALVSTWTSIGYYMIICLAGLSSVDPNVFEAAEIDGATGLKKVFRIYIPCLWNNVKVSVIMIVTGILKMFDTVYVLTPSGGAGNATVVPALLMYNESFRYNHYGKGAAIATVILILSIGVSLLSLRLMSRKE